MLLKWIIRVLSPMWLLVVGVFGALAIYGKGRGDQKTKVETKELKKELESLKRLKNVESNTTRDDALERLRKHGDLRD